MTYLLKETTGILSNKDKAWLEIACKLAASSTERFKHGAIIVNGGSVQGTGVNKNILDPHFHKDAPQLSIHAEEAALRRSVKTRGAVIYVARVNKHNEQRMSRPCDACMTLLKSFGVKRVVYTINCMEVL